MGNVMIDSETLGTRPGYVILTFGAVKFSLTGSSSTCLGESMYHRIALSSSDACGLKIDPQTLVWWMTEAPDEARREAFNQTGALPLWEALRELNHFVDGRADHVWSHGAGFDIPMIEAAAKAAGIGGQLFDFRNVRDTRTIYHAAGVKLDKKQGLLHHALDDAKRQALAVNQAWRKLNAG